MMNKSHELELMWNRLDAQKKSIEKDLKKWKWKKYRAERDLQEHSLALDVLKNLAMSLQSQVQTNLSSLCTQALKAVFSDVTYEFCLDFVSRRGQVECDMCLVTEHGTLDPSTDIGGGIVDLLSFAIRLACWSLSSPRPVPFFVLDEPFRHIAETNIEKAGEFLRRISDQLNVDVLLITHSDKLAHIADRVYLVEKEDGKSIVRLQT